MLAVSGCQNYTGFLSLYNQGEYDQAADVLGGEEALENDQNDLLNELYLASAFRAQGLFHMSTQSLDNAEQHLLWKEDGIQNFSDLIDASIGFFISEAATPYKGQIYEGVLLNTYKALNHLHTHSFDQARVEFNRASLRQDNAVVQLEEKVRALDQNDDFSQYQTLIDTSQDDILDQNPTLANRLNAVESLLESQKNLRNPFTEYLHGVFRLMDNDLNRASDLLRNATALSNNSYVLQDFALAEESASAASRPNFRRVWILYEDGSAPYLTPYDVVYPLFFETETEPETILVTFSVPEFNLGRPSWDAITVRADGRRYQTEPLLDLNQYVQTEFNATYPAVLRKAIASAVFKTVSQIAGSALAQEQDPFTQTLGIFTQLFGLSSAVFTQADTRSWSTLPNSIHIASLPMPESTVLTLEIGSQERHISLPEDKDFILISIKSVTPATPAVVYTASFDRMTFN